MDSEERTQTSIALTRTIFLNALDNPDAIMRMIEYDVKPQDIEDKVYRILEYIEMTTPEEAEA